MQPSLKEPKRKRRGNVRALLRFEEKTPWRGLSSISWWAPRHPYRGDGPVNAFELRVLRHPSRPFFPSFLLPPDSQAERKRGDRVLRKGVCNTHVFSFSGAVKYLVWYFSTFLNDLNPPPPSIHSLSKERNNKGTRMYVLTYSPFLYPSRYQSSPSFLRPTLSKRNSPSAGRYTRNDDITDALLSLTCGSRFLSKAAGDLPVRSDSDVRRNRTILFIDFLLVVKEMLERINPKASIV